MALYNKQGSNVWRYEFQIGGSGIAGTTRTSAKTLAADVLRLRRCKAEQSFVGIKKRELPKTFSAAVDEFLFEEA